MDLSPKLFMPGTDEDSEESAPTEPGAFQQLVAWQKAMDFVTCVYEATATFPKSEDHGLNGQLRRSSISIPSNIAEGSGRVSAKEFVYFLYVAKGSLREAETQIEIARRIGYLSDETANKLQVQLASVSRLLNGLIKSKKPNPPSGPRH